MKVKKEKDFCLKDKVHNQNRCLSCSSLIGHRREHEKQSFRRALCENSLPPFLSGKTQGV